MGWRIPGRMLCFCNGDRFSAAPWGPHLSFSNHPADVWHTFVRSFRCARPVGKADKFNSRTRCGINYCRRNFDSPVLKFMVSFLSTFLRAGVPLGILMGIFNSLAYG